MIKRNSLQIFKSVIYALLIREIKTRFSTSKFGYLLAILEPLSHILIISLIFSLIRKTEYFGIDISLFLAVSILPWIYFNNTINKLTKSFSANQALFLYKQVKPIDTIFSRKIIEFLLIFFVAISLYLIGISLGYKINIKSISEVLIVFFTIVYFYFSFALFLSMVFFFYPFLESLFKLIMKPMYFLSAIFYPVSIIPNEYKYIFEYNPIANAIELLRFSFFNQIKECYGSLTYLFILGTIFLFSGLFIYRNFEYKILETK